jgi:hypothetical protein
VADHGANAIVITLYIHTEYTVEILLSRGFDIAHVGNTGIIHENMNALVLRNVGEACSDLYLIAYIASVSRRPSAGTGNLGCNCSCILFVDVENMNYGAIRGKLKRDSATDATPAAGDNRGLGVEPE